MQVQWAVQSHKYMLYNLSMPSYTVSLRISSRTLDTAQITRELGLVPTQTRAAGERRSEHTVWDEAMWEFEVFPEGRHDWDSLESGLVALLKTFIPHTKTLQEYRDRYDVFVWCGQFSEGPGGFGGGPTLSAQVLKSLGNFGMRLELKAYLSDQKILKGLRP